MKKMTFGVLILVIIMAGFEMIGVASIMPFMALVSKPSVIETNYYFNYLFNFFEFKKHEIYIFYRHFGFYNISVFNHV